MISFHVGLAGRIGGEWARQRDAHIPDDQVAVQRNTEGEIDTLIIAYGIPVPAY